MENGPIKSKGTIKRSPEELFNKFAAAEDCSEILQTFQRLVNSVGVVAETPRDFYNGLKTKLQSWRCKSLWELLDNRANQKEYCKGTVCEDIHALVIGCGPIGLRTAIELALLGAQVVIVEKRKSFSRYNVLHLWPFLLTDFRSLGAKKFYGKFCSGTIDHISIRRLQAILLKTALILGVKVFTGVTFEKFVEPANEDEGWKCHVTPFNDALSDFEVDVVIGADGKKNVLPGFAQIEMRGTLAIGITANFVNSFSEEETKVEEISGIGYQFNPAFFDKLKQQKGIQLENIVYYKDETHYFVMTAVKSSLLKRGVLKKDYGNKPLKLLSHENVDQASLISFVNDTVSYATNGLLNQRELKCDDRNNADVAVFDFTSIKKAENSARILERKGHKLLLGLVGDSLLEPFWPTGSGCARGVLSALDVAWMVRAFAQDKPPLQILSERENIYRLLSGTSSENLHKNHVAYTINPSSRYTHIPQKKIQEVYHLYETDDPVNADFSLGSPTGILISKGSRKKRISTAAKPQCRPSRKHIKFAAHPTFDLPLSSSGSSMEDLTPRGTHKKSKIDKPKARRRSRTWSENMTSGGEEVHEITKASKWGKREKKVRSALSPLNHGNQLNVPKSSIPGSGARMKAKKQKVERIASSPATGSVHQEKTHKRRSFFAFGRRRSKSRTGRKSAGTPDVQKENGIVEEKIESTVENKVETSNGDLFSQEGPKRDIGSFSRNHPMRRSARDIIAEIEARNSIRGAATGDTVSIPRGKHSAMRKFHDRSLEERTTNDDNKSNFKRTTSDSIIYQTPPSKQSKTEDIWKELESMSPCAKGAVPALLIMSPQHQKENDHPKSHSLYDIHAAMRIAGLMAMATPLLVTDCGQQGFLGKELPWYSRNTGRVKDVISKYDSLTGRRILSKDGTPLRAPNDSVDNADRKPTLAEVAQRILAAQKATKNEQTNDGRTGEMTPSWQPTAIAFVEDNADQNTDKAMAIAREKEMEKLRLLEKQLSSLDQESTDSPVKNIFSSPIYRKTFIAELNNAGTAAEKDAAKIETPIQQLSVPRDYAQEGAWRKSPALAKKEMERLLLNLIETMSHERAEASLKFLISMFRRIQRNPKEDKFRRIFKSRVKFKKYVWTVRNAKMFILASGWVEVGSFLLFPAEKNVREPLAVLNKHLGLLVSGSSVQISTIKSIPRRDSNTKNPRIPKTLPSEIDSTTSLPQKEQVTPLRPPGRSSSKETSLDKRFSKSVPLNLNSDGWDLEMEDPLEQVGVTHSGKTPRAPRRMVSSALEIRTPRTPATSDFAIIEELDELSNTLDDLMESLDDVDQDVENEKKASEKRLSPQEIKDLCTTLDYLLDSSEEEELDRDLNSFGKGTKVDINTSAFTKVVTPLIKRTQPISESNPPSTPVDKDEGCARKKEDSVSISRNHGISKLDELERKLKGPLEAKKSNLSSSANNETKDETKQTSRRKLPKEPDVKTVPNKETDRQSSLANSQALDQAKQLPKKHGASGRSTGNLARQMSQESLAILQRRFASENNISSSSSSARPSGNSKEKPFALKKRKAQSIADRSASESGTEGQHSLTKNTHKTPITKSQSAINVSNRTHKHDAEQTSADKSDQTSETNNKDSKLLSKLLSKSSSYDSVAELKKHDSPKRAERSKANLTRESSNTESISSLDSASSKGRPPSGLERSRSIEIVSKSSSYDSVAEFKKPDSPKPRKRAERSKANLTRESSNTESISSLDSTSSKGRPPSGLERSRSARAKRMQEIATRLACLESSYDSLENSPKKTASRKASSSSSVSTSSRTKTVSTTTGTEPQRSSLRRNNVTAAKRTNSATSQSSVTSQDSHGGNVTACKGIPAMRTRSRSAPKRTPSTASLERKKMDGLLSKEEQGPTTRRPKSSTNKSDGNSSILRDKKPLRRANAMDGSQATKTDPSGSERSSIKTKHRKLPSTNSNLGKANRKDIDKTSKSQEDTNKVISKSDVKDATKGFGGRTYEAERTPSRNSNPDCNDSFDNIIVTERSVLAENVVDGDLNMNSKSEQTVKVVDKMENSGGHPESNVVSLPLRNEDVEKILDEAASTQDLKREKSEGNLESDDDLKVELKLQNTGSWMVLNYEGLDNTPAAIRKDYTSESTQEHQNSTVVRETEDSVSSFDAGDEEVVTKIEVVGAKEIMESRKNSEDDFSTGDDVVRTNGKSLDNGEILHGRNRSNGIDHHGESVKPHENGSVATRNDSLEGSEIVRRNALRKKKGTKSQQKPSKAKKIQSIDTLPEGKTKIHFGEVQHIEVKSLERSAKETKNRRHLPFGLRRKKISESCPDINGACHGSPLETASPIISSSLSTSTSSTSLAKKAEKKKLSPFKLLTKRRKSSESSSLKNA